MIITQALGLEFMKWTIHTLNTSYNITWVSVSNEPNSQSDCCYPDDQLNIAQANDIAELTVGFQPSCLNFELSSQVLIFKQLQLGVASTQCYKYYYTWFLEPLKNLKISENENLRKYFYFQKISENIFIFRKFQKKFFKNFLKIKNFT